MRGALEAPEGRAAQGAGPVPPQARGEVDDASDAALIDQALSVADLALWYLLEMIRDNGLGASMADYPVIGGFFERIAMRPRIAAYLSSPKRPALMLLPV